MEPNTYEYRMPVVTNSWNIAPNLPAGGGIGKKNIFFLYKNRRWVFTSPLRYRDLGHVRRYDCAQRADANAVQTPASVQHPHGLGHGENDPAGDCDQLVQYHATTVTERVYNVARRNRAENCPHSQHGTDGRQLGWAHVERGRAVGHQHFLGRRRPAQDRADGHCAQGRWNGDNNKIYSESSPNWRLRIVDKILANECPACSAGKLFNSLHASQDRNILYYR